MNDWADPQIAPSMRANADAQIREWVPGDGNTPHFDAFVTAVASTECPGSILEIGCGIGHNRELLDRTGVQYRSFAGIDVNEAATRLATERYPESQWYRVTEDTPGGKYPAEVHSDIVIDGSAILHIENWRQHIGRLCAASRRWVILHRFPISKGETHRVSTEGYGHEFKAWVFHDQEVFAEFAANGFQLVRMFEADGNSMTVVFAKPRHFVTYCDRNYLSRIKALHASMLKHCGPFLLHVLAYDAEVGEWARSAANVVAESYADLIVRNPGWYEPGLPGPPRTHVEHMWTIGTCWVADVLERVQEPVTYVDADILFHSSPEPMFAEIGNAPAGFVGHNLATASQNLPGPTVETHDIFGRWNVGLVHFAKLSIAKRWAEMCREWCYDRVEEVEATGGPVPQANRRLRYGDQKFLEDLMVEFPGIVGLKNTAAMVGPWNIHTRALDMRDGWIYFGGRRLISYHYSALVLHDDNTVTASREEYNISPRQQDLIYRPYLSALDEVIK